MVGFKSCAFSFGAFYSADLPWEPPLMAFTSRSCFSAGLESFSLNDS